MKPFDLQKAKEGHPLVTRDGRPARFIAHVPECDEQSRVIVLISGCYSCTHHTEEGNFWLSKQTSTADLFLATTKRTYWFAYSSIWNTGERCTTCLYSTKEKLDEALRTLSANIWTTTSIEIEE